MTALLSLEAFLLGFFSVHVYFFSPQRDQIPPISDITSRLAESLSQQDVELVADIISETPVSDDARPAILLCINVSRVGTDVANALKDMKGKTAIFKDF